MPHITVDYSGRLDDAFDRLAFAKELDPLVVTESRSAGVCKVFFRPAALTFVAGTVDDPPFAHVEIGLLPGRSEAQKAQLAEAVLTLLTRHVPERLSPVLSVEVRDLAASYRLRGHEA